VVGSRCVIEQNSSLIVPSRMGHMQEIPCGILKQRCIQAVVSQPFFRPYYRLLRFSISASLSRPLIPVSTDVEFDCVVMCFDCVVICVVSPHSRSLHLSVTACI
jgi:hypothetical protein